MAEVQHFFYVVLDFLRAGFNQVNVLLGILIALIAAFRMDKWMGLWSMALAAMLIHLIITAVTKTPVGLPNILYVEFWRNAAALYAGYVIIIAVFYFLRMKFTKKN